MATPKDKIGKLAGKGEAELAVARAKVKTKKQDARAARRAGREGVAAAERGWGMVLDMMRKVCRRMGRCGPLVVAAAPRPATLP